MNVFIKFFLLGMDTCGYLATQKSFGKKGCPLNPFQGCLLHSLFDHCKLGLVEGYFFLFGHTLGIGSLQPFLLGIAHIAL